MKRFCLLFAAAGAMSLLSACETKVVNQPPAADRTEVIERDRPVVTEHEHEATPPVENNIHVDR